MRFKRFLGNLIKQNLTISLCCHWKRKWTYVRKGLEGSGEKLSVSKKNSTELQIVYSLHQECRFKSMSMVKVFLTGVQITFLITIVNTICSGWIQWLAVIDAVFHHFCEKHKAAVYRQHQESSSTVWIYGDTYQFALHNLHNMLAFNSTTSALIRCIQET